MLLRESGLIGMTPEATMDAALEVLWSRVRGRRFEGPKFRRLMDEHRRMCGVRSPMSRVRIIVTAQSPNPHVTARPAMMRPATDDGYLELVVWAPECLMHVDRLLKVVAVTLGLNGDGP